MTPETTSETTSKVWDVRKIKIGEFFEIEGLEDELAVLELHESYNVGGKNRHFILKLEIVGREASTKFSEEEIERNKLPFIPFDSWNNMNHP